MSVFFSYIILGLSLAAPIGPVNAAQIDRGIKNGFLNSWLVGLGATVADAIYMCFVYFGVVQFIEIPYVQLFLWVFGFFLLIYLGMESINSAGRMKTETRTLYRESKLKSFSTGFFMSLFNPLSILFWLGIFGSIIAKTITMNDTYHVILYCAAIFLGITIWDLTMAALASSMRHLLTNRFLFVIAIISGFSLIGFGVYFGYQALDIIVF
ncbi:LysE family transporter [Halalkalibacter sp. APA_J-10(15)]|uniref:LysE family transporter n=1 Tax=unclassified Halalkalibacter TaxID=2893063 RepID=UPI001FF51D4A|nr:LysE family transporter [Halalkalibacter sp. APA_J-10(15)]MCK0473110.1 LysE family translocator [Halalkalibacter sp. APA_J-10(15)]